MQNFTYRLADDETWAVVGYEGDAAEVVIPDTYLGRPVTVIFDCLFRGHAEIERVRIPDTVTDIGEFAFDGCAGLRELKLPAALCNVWQYAFVRSGLETVELPAGVRNIPPFAFKDCRALRRVVCNPGLKKIYPWAFQGCGRPAEFRCGPQTEIDARAFESTALNA